MNHFYHVQNLNLQHKKDICNWAKKHCDNWWVDVLDCNKSWFREKIEMDFHEIMGKLDDSCHFVVIRRMNENECYIEVGFSTMTLGPNYFLWITLDPKYHDDIEKLISPDYTY